MTSTGTGDDEPLRADATLPEPLDRADVSRQARLLHLLALEHSVGAGAGGVIGVEDAERLAARAGALPEELVEAGWWLADGNAYRVRAVHAG